MVSTCTCKDGTETMTAVRGERKFIRPMSDLGTGWLYASVVDSLIRALKS